MPDEHPPGVRIAGEQPSIPVGTAVNLSGGLPGAPDRLEPCSRRDQLELREGSAAKAPRPASGWRAGRDLPRRDGLGRVMTN
jgi:hypothetical protein